MRVANHGSAVVKVQRPKTKTIEPGKFWGGTFSGSLQLSAPSFSELVPDGRYWVVSVDAAGGASAHDTNDLQMELSAAAQACFEEREAGVSQWEACLGKKSFGGLPKKFVSEAFKALWESYDYWRLCEASPPSPAVRSLTSSTGETVEVIREKPLVATVRGFLSEERCKKLIDMAGFDSLVRAHTGAGGGRTATSEARETLTTNMFVDWNKKDPLSEASVKMFDLASELMGDRVPYEGQEPVNFLHYLKGFEYKPHMDGSGERTGKRVATTLSYCQAATSGGATVFPGTYSGEPLKFSPGPGDVLFFQYAPDPSAAMHAACPVGAGNKTTLTQWHRLGVSSQKPWDNFEDWGKFHNPHADSRWRGPRYGAPSARAEM